MIPLNVQHVKCPENIIFMLSTIRFMKLKLSLINSLFQTPHLGGRVAQRMREH